MLNNLTIYQLVKDRVQQHGKSQSISELCLDQIAISTFEPQFNQVIQKCQNLVHLSVASCALTSLSNFPKISKLKYLDLQQNSFNDNSLIELTSQFQSLDGINLSKNNIKKLEAVIQCINKLSIKQINIFETPLLSSFSKVIESLFQNCKTLQCVNWQDNKGKQVKQFEQQSESSESQSQSQSENNERNYSQDEQIQNSMSMQSSKKLKVE